MQKQGFDTGKGKSEVGVLSNQEIHDRSNHSTRWQITRFSEDVFMNRVKSLWDKASEALILAGYYFRHGNIAAYEKWKALSDVLMAEGESNAYNISVIEGNILLNEGINALWNIACGNGSETAWNNANARLGVGDSSTAENATQTDLQASTNKLYKAMDGGYPTSGTSQKGTWKSTFGSSEANYAWNEFVIDNGGTALKTMNRKVSSQGTKISGQIWAASADITLS